MRYIGGADYPMERSEKFSSHYEAAAFTEAAVLL
jgi:hypothetical protein